MVVALQAVVCAWGVPGGLHNFLPEAIRQASYYVRSRVSCCALRYFVSNLGVTLWVRKWVEKQAPLPTSATMFQPVMFLRPGSVPDALRQQCVGGAVVDGKADRI